MTEEQWLAPIKEEEISFCIDWLKKQDITKMYNKRLHSYTLKHVIENYYDTYIYEGSLIEAVKRLDIPYKEVDTWSKRREPDGTITQRTRSIYLPLSLKTVRYYSDKTKNAI